MTPLRDVGKANEQTNKRILAFVIQVRITIQMNQ